MEVDKRETVVGLVQVHVGGFVVDIVGDRKVCLIVENNGRGGGCRGPPPFFQFCLFILFLDCIMG